MNQKNSISFIDFVLVIIIIFYMEYRICMDLLEIYISVRVLKRLLTEITVIKDLYSKEQNLWVQLFLVF